jgi:hypothetical protein
MIMGYRRAQRAPSADFAMRSSNTFAPITDAVLARARREPDFRRQLLAQNLDLLLTTLQKLRGGGGSSARASADEVREGVALAVRLAELIQAAALPSRGP